MTVVVALEVVEDADARGRRPQRVHDEDDGDQRAKNLVGEPRGVVQKPV